MPAGAVCVPDISALLPDAEDHRNRFASRPHWRLRADGRQRRQSDTMVEGLVGMALPQAHDVFQRSGNGMSIKKVLFGGGVETNATASYQGSIQDWLPVKNIISGVVITKDNRFIKILEIVPVNIYLKSAEDRQAIVEAFAAYLKIAPDHMQFEARTLPADISRYVERMQEYAKNEDNAYCREMIQDNIQDIGMGVASNALQHRFFMVFQYESQMRASPNTVQGIIQRLNEEADTARRYLDLCELEVQEPRYADDFALELLYEIINKRTSQRVKLPEGVFDMTTAVHGVYEAQTQ